MKTTSDMSAIIRQTVSTTPVFDIHTHIYDTNFGNLLLWGVDELLTYHYLIAEVFRAAPMPYESFWAMNKQQQADYIWQELFIKRTPISEACRGVISCLTTLGLDTNSRDLDSFRGYFQNLTAANYIDIVFEKSNVERCIMTNDPFDADEKPVWEKISDRDKRFLAALRIDKLLVDWPSACEKLKGWGYDTEERMGAFTMSEIRRFLTDWSKIMRPVYMAASLPPAFTFPEDSACGRIIDECILPVGRELNLPFAMMIGVKKLINPNLRLAGDSVGKASITSVERLCSDYPDNKFLVTMLSRENQHELCITARKNPNLHIFGCWWFLNNPSIIDEMTRERLELLGFSMTPQHSDARVLDQLMYKWKHSREVISNVLIDKYADLAHDGWKTGEEEIKRDVRMLFGASFEEFVNR